MKEEFYRTSKITGRTYDLFSTVKILNIQQICHYCKMNVPIEDIQVSQDRNGRDILVFLVDREKSYNAYDDWCKRKQVKTND